MAQSAKLLRDCSLLRLSDHIHPNSLYLVNESLHYCGRHRMLRCYPPLQICSFPRVRSSNCRGCTDFCIRMESRVQSPLLPTLSHRSGCAPPIPLPPSPCPVRHRGHMEPGSRLHRLLLEPFPRYPPMDWLVRHTQELLFHSPPPDNDTIPGSARGAKILLLDVARELIPCGRYPCFRRRFSK